MDWENENKEKKFIYFIILQHYYAFLNYVVFVDFCTLRIQKPTYTQFEIYTFLERRW